jgi:2-phosphoglycerate kinase
MADLLVVTGPPGAGKSTVSQLLAADFDPGALVAGDQFFGFLRAGFIDPWRPESDKQNEVVTQSAAAAVGKLVQGGITVVYDGVVGPWFVPAFLAGTGLDRLHYAVLMPEEVCCTRRVRERSGHGFTDIPATRHMYREFACADVNQRHVLPVDERDTPETTAAAVRQRRADGSLAWHR